LANAYASAPENSRSFSSVVIFALMALATIEFGVRGPWRALHSVGEFNDFISPYVQTRVWLAGQDPYDLTVLARAWPYQRSSLDTSLVARGIPSPYPITGFPLLAPLAAISWEHASLLWLIAEGLFLALFLASLSSIATSTGAELYKKHFIFGALALAPLQTGFAVENMTIAAIALATAAVACDLRQRNILAGILLACGIALKPTIVAGVLIYFIVRRRWQAFGSTIAGCAALLIAAEARMTWAGTHWLPSFLLNQRHLFAAGTVYDFSSANSLRFDLVNFQLVVSQFGISLPAAQYVPFGIALTALLLWVYFRNNVQSQPALLDLAIASSVTLLPIYHRFYDAGLLIFPLAWAITQLSGPLARHARVCLFSVAPFLVPGAAMLRLLANSIATVASMSRSWWWNIFVAPHQAWLILAILLVLISAQRVLASEKIELPSALAAAEAA